MAEDRMTLTTTEYAALARELEALRSRHSRELAERLRVARGYGGAADNDDLLAVLEEAAIDEARIAQLEEQVRTARVVDAGLAGSGATGLGATVRVIDDDGRECEYELVGRRNPDSRRHEVTPASPVGEALMGARVGDLARVELPNGRMRVLEVLEVRYAHTAKAA
jgi:transcription elongation factor GreA